MYVPVCVTGVCVHYTHVYLYTWSASIFVCVGRAPSRPVDLRLVPTVPFFSSEFSVALFSAGCFPIGWRSVQGSYTDDTLGKSPERLSLPTVITKLQICSALSDMLVQVCRSSRLDDSLTVWRLGFWKSFRTFWEFFSKWEKCVGALNASFSWHMTHPTYCT